MIPMDFHTHTIASGHGTVHTISDLAKMAQSRGMTALGISDHGPATPGSCNASYFRTLKLAPSMRCGISVYYGAEANILDEDGQLDLDSETLECLDYVIASIHTPSFRPAHKQNMVLSCQEQTDRNTRSYINAMNNPYVRIIGHSDDAHFPIDALRLVKAAAEHKVILEVNEASLRPGGYRGTAHPIMYELLSLCLKFRHPLLLSSDSHGSQEIGNMPYAIKLVQELQYPRELIFNFQKPESLLNFR